MATINQFITEKLLLLYHQAYISHHSVFRFRVNKDVATLEARMLRSVALQRCEGTTRACQGGLRVHDSSK